jgi:hypothetical protein
MGLEINRVNNGSSGMRPSTLLHLLLLLLSMVAAASASQLISMDHAATNMYDDSTMIIIIPAPSHMPIGVRGDISLPEKKGGGGHGSGGYGSGGSGGHNAVRPGGGAPGGHKSTGARLAVPMSFQILVWIVLPGVAATLCK